MNQQLCHKVSFPYEEGFAARIACHNASFMHLKHAFSSIPAFSCSDCPAMFLSVPGVTKTVVTIMMVYIWLVGQVLVSSDTIILAHIYLLGQVPAAIQMTDDGCLH